MSIRFHPLLAAIVALLTLASARADLAPLSVSGRDLVAAGHPIRLRGIDWGWWHLKNTKYTEDDMKQQASWGTNVARLAMTYTDVEDPANPGKLAEGRVKDVDEVVSWAKKYNVYVILDMHVVAGGQDPAPYEDGGKNLLWKDPAYQQRLLSIWTELAKRYRNEPAVGAYEIMNEPCSQGAFAKCADLYNKAIAAIRAVDPGKVIVVGGDDWSNAKQLTDLFKMADTNILYTFHFYDGLPDQKWLSNAPEGNGISGTQDWTKVEVPIDVPANAQSLAILLRSNENSGTAWFDDVTLTDSWGNVVQSYTFDSNAKPFHVERAPATNGNYDPLVGHDKPGSLKVSGTTSYNGYMSQRVSVAGGRKYKLSAWVKLDNATGSTYLCAAFFGITANEADRDTLKRLMQPAIDFGAKYNVPLWVGEFGCGRELPEGLQHSWVLNCIAAFEENKLNWTYWNYKEDSGPGGMGLEPEKHDGSNYPVNDDLLSALKEGWQLNSRK